MAIRIPLVVLTGQVRQLPAGDKISGTPDPPGGTYAPGDVKIDDGAYAVIVKRLTMTGAQRLTGSGTARLRGI